MKLTTHIHLVLQIMKKWDIAYIMLNEHMESFIVTKCVKGNTTVVPKVMSNFFLHANWEQQTKESRVVGGTSCCFILECLVTSIACIT